MNVLLIIAEEEYIEEVKSKLANAGYFATEVGSNGGFLEYGEVVLILGVDQCDTEKVMSLLEKIKVTYASSLDKDAKIQVFSIHASQYIKKNG